MRYCSAQAAAFEFFVSLYPYQLFHTRYQGLRQGCPQKLHLSKNVRNNQTRLIHCSCGKVFVLGHHEELHAAAALSLKSVIMGWDSRLLQGPSLRAQAV